MKKILFILCVCIFSSNSYAYKLCEGKVKDVWTENDGDTYINGSWRNAHTKICNVKNVWKTIEPDVCKVWISYAQLAYASDATLMVRYFDSDVTSCAEIPDYGAAPAPNYLMLRR